MNNSVFISYRRNVSSYIARAVFQDLRANGIDTFMDVESIDSGQFDTIILNQIAARPYFLIILTPGTLDRCNESGDWLLHEIDHAISLKRVIIPLITPNFSFDDAKKFLDDPLATELPRFNAVSVPHDYFEAAMERLRTRFLKPIDLPITPTPKADEAAVQQKVAQVAAEPVVTAIQLNAQLYFERAYQRFESDPDGAIADFNLAIQLNPEYAAAYNNRAFVRNCKEDWEDAIVDCTEAIRLDPQYAAAYTNRAYARQAQGDIDGAIVDYGEAIQLDPQYAVAYSKRGIAHFVKGHLDEAIADQSEAIRLNPKYIQAYYSRGYFRYNKGDLDGSIADYSIALNLDPQNIDGFIFRGMSHADKGELDHAIADYSTAIWLNPQFAIAYNKRGVTRKAQGDVNGAIADYNEALRLNPQDADAYYNRALARAETGDYLGAIADSQRFWELQPYDPDVKKVENNIDKWSKLIYQQ